MHEDITNAHAALVAANNEQQRLIAELQRAPYNQRAAINVLIKEHRSKIIAAENEYNAARARLNATIRVHQWEAR